MWYEKAEFTEPFVTVILIRMMAHAEFLKFISLVKNRLGSYPNEQSVSVQVVLPVLSFLDWDTCNPDYVYPEYPLEKLKVDYGLKISEGDQEGLRCIIEVKAEGNLDADRQLFQYAFIAGSPLAVLTDGRHWRFYLPMLPGKFEERLVRTLDFSNHSDEEIVNGLIRYLSFENTRSGMARENAEKDHNQRIKTENTKKNVSAAWEKLLDGSSDKLVTLLVEETSQISSGYAPARSDVEGFLRKKNIEENREFPSRTKPKPSNAEGYTPRKTKETGSGTKKDKKPTKATQVREFLIPFFEEGKKKKKELKKMVMDHFNPKADEGIINISESTINDAFWLCQKKDKRNKFPYVVIVNDREIWEFTDEVPE